MKEDSRLMYEIAELTLHSMNGVLDDTGLRQLEELLAGNPVAVEYYQEILWTHVGLKSIGGISCLQENNDALLEHDFWQEMLQEEKNAPEIVIPEEEPHRELIQKVVYPPREKRKVSKFSIFTLVLSTAAMLFVALFLKFSSEKSRYDAVIVDSFDARWADPSKPDGIGSELSYYDGDRWLQGGYIKLLFGCNAEVVIESPARFEILSDNELNILSGRAYSTVSEGAGGFTIFTPNSQIIDLGTEFGVEVLSGYSSVHMIKGKAAVIPNSTLRKQKAIELIANQAKVIAQNGITQDTRVDKEKFVSDISSKMRLIYRADTAIPIGTWDRLLPADLVKDLRTDGRLIQAVNLGPQSAKTATICGISFEPLTHGETVTGGKSVEVADKFKFYTGSDEDLASLLIKGIALDNKEKTQVKIMIDGLKVGHMYRLQLIFNFPWFWCDINCYGFDAEYMYFPNKMDEPQLGLATYIWNARATTGKIELTSPRRESNLVHVLGYVLHEIGESEGNLRKN